MDRLGVNAVRIFANTVYNLRSMIGSTLWGQDLKGQLVQTPTTFKNAVQHLRLSSSHSLNSTAGLKNPIKWYSISQNFAKMSNLTGSADNTIRKLKSIGINSILLVEQIGCEAGSGTRLTLSSMDNASKDYWMERWEMYKYSYALAVWTRLQYGLNMIEFYNEPDLDLGKCLNASLFREYYLVRAMSLQHAYTDLNNEYPLQPRLNPNVVASAFARATYGGDLTRYLGKLENF
jgi:hypothetical protein